MATTDDTRNPSADNEIRDQISLEASRALTLLDMARAALNEVDGVPDIWTYFEQTMHAHLTRIEALAERRS